MKIENGKLANSITGEGGGWGMSRSEATGTTIEYFEQNLGEYGIAWMIIKQNGVETGRHNCKYLESIEWLS